MAIKPILFNTEMVRAILDGRKTCTRRIVRPPYFVDGDENDKRSLITLRTATKNSSLYRQIGQMPYPDAPYRMCDILYVRESVFQGVGRYLDVSGETVGVLTNYFEYYADGLYEKDHWKDKYENTWMHRRPSIHMPKEAARIWLKVTDVRVERLQEMKPVDVIKEGAYPDCWDCLNTYGESGSQCCYGTEEECSQCDEVMMEWEKLWNSTIKKSDLDRYGWDANPYVFVIEFIRIDKPEEI